MPEISSIFINKNGLLYTGVPLFKVSSDAEIIGVLPVEDIPINQLEIIHKKTGIEFSKEDHVFMGHNNIYFI